MVLSFFCVAFVRFEGASFFVLLEVWLAFYFFVLQSKLFLRFSFKHFEVQNYCNLQLVNFKKLKLGRLRL